MSTQHLKLSSTQRSRFAAMKAACGRSKADGQNIHGGGLAVVLDRDSRQPPPAAAAAVAQRKYQKNNKV